MNYQQYSKLISENLVKIGINQNDADSLSNLIENGDIHSINNDIILNFQNTISENKKVAFRRTFGKNAIVYGPEGIAVIEHDQILYTHQYKKGVESLSSFETATRGFSKFDIYNNPSINEF